MASDTNLIADLVRAGVDAELVQRVSKQLAYEEARADLAEDAIADAEAKAALRREREAARKRAARPRMSADVRGQDRKSAEGADPPKVSPRPPSSTPKYPRSPKGDLHPRAAAKPTPLSKLETVLDEERASAVVEHRRRIRKPLTAHAAQLLAQKFAKAPDPNAAADVMIANGWSGFELEWLENRRGRTSTGPPAQTFHDIARNGLGDHHDDEREHPGPTLSLIASSSR